MITIQISDAEVRVTLANLARQVKSPRGLMAVVSREAANQLKTHFRAKDLTEPNKLGGRRQHFWRAVGQSVQNPRISADGNEAVVAVSHPVAGFKLRGGLVTAKRVRFLTIPVSKEAYGRRASTLEHEAGIKLFVLCKKDGGNGALAAADKSGQVTVHYLLRRSVHIPADPTVLPPETKLLEAMRKRAAAYIERIKGRAS